MKKRREKKREKRGKYEREMRKWDELGKLGKEFNLLSGGREGFS